MGNPGAAGFASLALIGYFTGSPFGTFYGPEISGFFDPGGWMMKDLNGDGTYNEPDDWTILGTALPKASIGWVHHLKLRKF